MGEEGTPKTEMINPALLDGVSANFIVKGPSGVEKAYPMRAITVTIGRSDQCDIAVKDTSMSGRHAEISKINGEIRVKDMGSAAVGLSLLIAGATWLLALAERLGLI